MAKSDGLSSQSKMFYRKQRTMLSLCRTLLYTKTNAALQCRAGQEAELVLVGSCYLSRMLEAHTNITQCSHVIGGILSSSCQLVLPVLLLPSFHCFSIALTRSIISSIPFLLPEIIMSCSHIHKETGVYYNYHLHGSKRECNSIETTLYRKDRSNQK